MISLSHLGEHRRHSAAVYDVALPCTADSHLGERRSRGIPGYPARLPPIIFFSLCSGRGGGSYQSSFISPPSRPPFGLLAPVTVRSPVLWRCSSVLPGFIASLYDPVLDVELTRARETSSEFQFECLLL